MTHPVATSLQLLRRRLRRLATVEPVPAAHPPPDVTEDDLVDELRRRGVRVTAARRAVLRALAELGSHATAEALHAHVARDRPGVNESSVYRTMDLLTRLGVVTHVHLGHGPAEYHLAGDEHAHVVCESCGHVAELGPDLTGPFAAAVADALGVELELRHFALTGRCRRCANLTPTS